MNILEILRNMNLEQNRLNIVGIGWFMLTGLFLYWFYLRCGHNKYRPLFAAVFAGNSMLMLHILSDELNLWVFILTRESFFVAYVQYFSIPDKYARLFIVLITLYILTTEKYGFNNYWNIEGLLVILGFTTAFAIMSVFTGMYGWEVTDPTNLGKYFYTYIVYYVMLFALVFRLYPTWLQIKLHIIREHPELRRDNR